MNQNNSDTEYHFERKDKLEFVHLPKYASWLMENKLEEFAAYMLKVSRDVEVPLLKFLAHLPEEQIKEMSLQGSTEILTAFAENKIKEYVDNSLRTWITKQLPLNLSDSIAVDDISTVMFVRKKALRDFLPLYSKEIPVYIGVMEEVDRYMMDMERLSYNILFNQKKEKLAESEELHNQAQALTHLGNWSLNLDTGKMTWSDELYRIYGIEPQAEEITLERTLEMTFEGDRDRRRYAFEKAISERVADEYDIRIVTTYGIIRMLHCKTDVLLDKSNKPYGLVGTCQDITTQFLLNEQIAENEKTFRELIANAPDGVILINEQSEIILWNPKAEFIFGWTFEEVRGKTLMETIMPPQHRTAHMAGIKRLHDTGEARILNKTLELTAINKDGTEFFVALSVARSLRRGEPVYISFIRDISREKNAEMELEQQRNQIAQKNIELERSNQELMAFNYIASHDLKEPVRKIKVFGNRIIEKNQETVAHHVQDSVERIVASADHMEKLIDALLAFSRTSSVERVYEQVDLNVTLDEIKFMLRDRIEEKNVRIISDDLPVVNAVAFQMQQLFENLISNAIKYSSGDSVPVININTEIVHGKVIGQEGAIPDKKYHHIIISDNGIGFEAQYATRIFGLFQRLHGKNEYSGTGIGLAICKRIMQNHDGFISASGELNKGATFNVYIPVESVK